MPQYRPSVPACLLTSSISSGSLEMTAARGGRRGAPQGTVGGGELAELLPGSQLVLHRGTLRGLPPAEPDVADRQHRRADGQRPRGVRTTRQSPRPALEQAPALGTSKPTINCWRSSLQLHHERKQGE